MWKNLRTTISRLPSSIETFKNMLKAEQEVNAALIDEMEARKRIAKDELKMREPLVQIGVKIRRRFLEHGKQQFINGTYMDVGGIEDQEIIEAGNRAAHHANIAADTSLYRLGFLDVESRKDQQLYASIYWNKYWNILPLDSRSMEWAMDSKKRAEMVDMNYTWDFLAGCKNRNVEELGGFEEFKRLEWETNAIWEDFAAVGSSDAEWAAAFDMDPTIEGIVQETRVIFDEMVNQSGGRVGRRKRIS
jgi:hypothetical protein